MTVQVALPEISQEFHKAHKHLIKKIGGADFIVRKSEFLKIHHLDVLRDAWIENYNIKIVENDKGWSGLEFVDEKQYTYFLLKWS